MDLLAVSNSNYMKQFIYILLLTVTGIFAGCTDIDKENPYDNQLHSLQVTAVYPDGYTDHLREGVTVKIEDVDRGNSYKAKTDKNGVAQFSLTKGIYRVQVSDKGGKDIFNGLADNVKLTFIPRPGRSLLKRFTAEDAQSYRWKEIISPTSTLSCIITTRKCNIWIVYASEHSTLTIHKPLMYG